PEPWDRVYSLSLPKTLLPLLQEFAKKYPSSSVSLIAPEEDSKSQDRKVILIRKDGESNSYQRLEYQIPFEKLTEFLTYILFDNHDDYSIPISSERDYFVCVHTNRDLCCGVFGNELYENLKRDSEIQKSAIRIFRCSHIGGHR